MGACVMLLLILLPMLSSVAVFSLRRRSREHRNRFIQVIPMVELALAVILLAFPEASLKLPGVCGLGMSLAAGELRSLLVLVTAFLWAMTGLNCPPYFASAEGCNRF